MKYRNFFSLAGFLILILISVVIPVSPHDWGDDFAMYIMQAARYTGDTSFDGLYIYNPNAPMYAPPSYPPAFPALLAPVYLFAGANLQVFQYYMCVLLALTGAAIFIYARSVKMHVILAVTVIVLVCFHSFTLELRQQILSDVPFVGLTFLFLYLYATEKKWYYAAGVAFIALLTRSTGVLLLIAWMADVLLIWLFEKQKKRNLQLHVYGLMLLILLTVVSSFIFPVFSGYSGSWNNTSVFSTMYENYYIYKAWYEYYFMFMFNIDEPVFKYISWPLLILFSLGIFSLFKSGNRIPVLFFFGYLILVLSYPYKYGGYRMLFPMIPFMWIFIFYGIQWLLTGRSWGVYVKSTLAILLALVITIEAVSYSKTRLPEVNYIQTPESTELFTAIKNKIPFNEIILSPRPRALVLFTKHPGIYMVRDSVEQNYSKKFMLKHKIKYLVTMKNNAHLNIDNLASDTSISTRIWNNSMYAIFRIKE